MSATCHPIPQTIAQDMLQGVVRAICDRPEETQARRDALSRGVVHSVMSFLPRDPVEIMLAGMTVTHFHLILDSAHDALRGQQDILKVRTKSGIVALDRAMTGLMKELRLAQTRPMEGEVAPDVQRKVAPAETVARSRTSAAGPEVATTKSKAATTASPKAIRPWQDAAPVPLLPASRSADTSVAAMLAVGSPPTTPFIVVPAAKPPVEAAPSKAPASGEAATREENLAAFAQALAATAKSTSEPAGGNVDQSDERVD